MYELIAESAFDSAHFLTDYHGKCENLHGHRWRVVATIGSDGLKASGDERDMVCDFSAFKEAVRTVCDSFDHTLLVEEGSLKESTIQALESEEFTIVTLPFRTTAENLAKHIFDILRSNGWDVVSVEVDETPNNRAIYRA